MSILAVYSYFGKDNIVLSDKSLLKPLTNPGAIHTISRIMVVNPLNTTFTLEQVEEIKNFVELERQKKWK
jgi:hypothetical protein